MGLVVRYLKIICLALCLLVTNFGLYRWLSTANIKNWKELSSTLKDQEINHPITHGTQKNISRQIEDHTGAKIHNVSKNSHFENLIFHKIHTLKI